MIFRGEELQEAYATKAKNRELGIIMGVFPIGDVIIHKLASVAG